MRTFSILYDRALTRAGAYDDQEKTLATATILMQRELLIVDPSVYHELEQHLTPWMDQLRPRCRLYFNPWGHASYRTAMQPWPVWQLGPGDLGAPDYVTSRGVHLYRMDDAHLVSWLAQAQLWPAVSALGAKVGGTPDRHGAGVFLDDMSGDRRHWQLDPAIADIVWAPADEKPGWRDGANWNLERIHLLEDIALAMCRRGLDGVVVNGSARRRGPRLFEGFGQWVTPQQLRDEARPGDLVQVNGLLRDPFAWATVDDDGARYGGFPLGTSFEAVYAEACRIAEQLGLRVGLAYRRRSDASIYTLIGHPVEGVV